MTLKVGIKLKSKKKLQKSLNQPNINFVILSEIRIEIIGRRIFNELDLFP